MFGMQDRVAIDEPIGGAPVQLPAPSIEQRDIDAIANERVSEQKIFALGPHQKMCNQIAATIVSVVDDVAQGIKRKSLGAITEAACSVILSSLSSRSIRARIML